MERLPRPQPGDLVIIDTIRADKQRKVARVLDEGFTVFYTTSDGDEIESLGVLPFWRIQEILGQPETADR